MSIDEKQRLMQLIDTLPKGHTRFFELSDGTDIMLTKAK
jgi:hypothetical protein